MCHSPHWQADRGNRKGRKIIRIAKSLAIIVAVAAIAVGATRATWTDQQIVGDNTFATGTLDISTNAATALFNATAIYPGWSETKNITVSNNGTVPLNYDIVATQSGGSDVLFSSPYFKIKIGTTAGAGDIFGGTDGVAMNSLTGLTVLRSLNAGNNETIYFTATLDHSAPDALQGLSTTVQFAFNGTQP